MPPKIPVYKPLRNWSYQVTGGEEPWAISPNLTNLPALSDSERAGLLDAQLGGARSPFLQEAEDYGFPIDSIIARPAIAHSAVADVRAASPTAPNTPKRRERVGLGEASALTWEALEDGVIETKISRIGYEAWRGAITREEALAGAAQLRSQMHDPNNDKQYGAALKAVAGAAGIGGQMLPSIGRGLVLGTASAAAVAPMGLATGPFSPLTVPALATSAFTVGATTGIMTAVAEDATGRSYLNLISQEYEMWPDLDNPGGYLSQREYEGKRETEYRYTGDGGYTAEIATIPDNIAKAISIAVGAASGGLELAQVKMLGGLFKNSRWAQAFNAKAVTRLIEGGQLIRFARVQAAKIATVGTQEIGIEMVQSGVEFTGAVLAGELNAMFNNANIPLGQQQEFFNGIGETMIRTAREVGSSMFVLAAIPGTTSGAVQWTMGRREATSQQAQRVRTLDGTTAGYFEQSTGEDVTISDIGVDETELIDRDKVIAASILEVASTSDVKLQPITVEVRPDGTLFATDPSAAAFTQVMRDAGAKSLRVVKRDQSKGLVDTIPPWEMFADTDVEAQIANQFPDNSVAEVRAKMVPLQLAAMRDNVSVTEWIDQHFQDGMLFRQPEVTADPEAQLALPEPTGIRRRSGQFRVDRTEPTAPASPTVDSAVFESIRMPDEALPPMARPGVVVEPEVPALPTVEGVAQAQVPGIEEIPELPEVTKEPTAPQSPIVETEAISLPELEAMPEAPAIIIEPRGAPAPVVEMRRSWRRRAFAMGRVIDELEFGWQSGEWKTPSGWLDDSGLSGLVTTQEMIEKLGTDNVVPADAFGFALRETMAQELLPPQEMVPPLSEAPEAAVEPTLPALPEVTALEMREPGVAEFAPRAPEAMREPPIPALPEVGAPTVAEPGITPVAPEAPRGILEPAIPAAPLAPPGPPPVAPSLPPVPPMEFADALLEDLDDAVEKELAAEQLRRMRTADHGADTPIPEGPVMSSKTYLVTLEADALKAADAFLAKAVKNVRMDLYEDTSGGYRTPPEHAALLIPVVEKERIRLETEAAQQAISSQRDLTRQMKREQREAALARGIEGELEPQEAEVPEIEDVPYHEGSVPRPELMPAFDTRIPVDVRPVIYVDMEEKPVILSGLSAYNAAVSRPGQTVEGTILRADEGVALEEAKEFAIRRGQEEPVSFPDDIPAVPVERVVIKSDGEEVGAVEFDRQGRALLETYDSTDFKSWVHGLSRVFRRMLPAREEAIAARWAGVSSVRHSGGKLDWVWDGDAEYRFASGFEQYLREGRVRATELQPIWKRLSDWTKASYAGNSARLNRRVRNVYESLLVDEKSPALKSYRSNIQMVGQVGQMVFRSPTSAYLLRLSATGGRDLTDQNLPPGPDRVRVDAMRQDGKVVLAREYKNLESAVRDISGIPSSDYPATVGDGSFRPFRAKRGANGGFNGPGPPGDPSALSPEVGPEGSVYVGDRVVDGNVFIADVIDRLDRLGPLHQSKLSKMLTSWRKYDYLTELLSSGVDGSLFQLLSRDMDTGRAAEKRLRYDLQAMLRDKLLRRGWSERDFRNLPRAMKEEVTVAGWKHAGAMKDPWTVGKLLSFNRHLRAGQNRATLLSRGFRDSPDGEIINVDEEDIQVLVKALGTLPEQMRDFGNEVVDELMDVLHERQDVVHRKARRRTLGYVPYYWDLERSPKDRTQATIDEEMEQADAIDRWRGQSDSKLGIYEGMTYHRTQKSAPVVLRPLDFQLLRNIDRASMYVGFELPLQAAAKLFDNSQAVAAMEERMDKSSVKGLQIGLEGIARRWIDEQNIDKTAAKIQRGVTVATLGGNPGVWVKQALSLPLYGVYVPGKYMTASLMRASVEGEFAQMQGKLKAFDPTFQARSRGFDISLQGALENSAAGEAWGKRRVSDLMMKGLGFFDQRTVVVGSHAAYLQAIDEFRTGLISEEVKRATGISTHAEAVALGPDGQAFKAYKYANWITYRTQPNFLPEHVSSFQRHKLTRFLAMFSGYTNTAYNLLLRTSWRARQTKGKADLQAMRKAFMWIFVGNTAGVMIIDFLNQIVRGTAPKEDELPSWAARKVITSSTSMLYILRDAAYAFTNPYGPDVSIPITSAASQIIAAMRAISDDLVDGEIRESTIAKLVTAAGITVGMPTGHLYRYTTGIMDLFDPMTQ